MTATQAPTPGPLDWTTWSGGPRPHPPATRVRVRYRDGTEDEGASAFCDWLHSPRRSDPKDVVAYKIVREAPTAPVEASGSKLHPATADLVDRFAAELKSKLARAEAKYGYQDNWSRSGWEDELIESLAEHIQKGDPRDVAAYCAFAWHHGWSTSDAAGYFVPALRPQPSGETRESVARVLEPWGPPQPGRGPVTVRRWEDALAKADAILALLSARPLALGGQQGDAARLAAWLRQYPIGTDGLMVKCKANEAADLLDRLSTTPARAEAQDEGAAREPVAVDYDPTKHDGFYVHREGTSICWMKDGAFSIWVPYDPSHPSPSPAADDDRVREAAIVAKNMADNASFNLNQAGLTTETATCDRAFLDIYRTLDAALKSTPAKEGGE